MRNTSLPSLEASFRQTGNDGEYSFRRISIPVANEQLKLNGLFSTPENRAGYYYATEYPKHRIVIHFTAGQIRSDMSALTRNEYHVSVPFVIDRDGTVYQLYSSKYWSGHLGKGLGNIGTGNAQDKCTIGIELSNYGFLTERLGNLETYYSRQKDSAGNAGLVDVYCSLGETGAYTKLDIPFRAESYYATFTEAQYESLIVLLRYLTTQYQIPREFLPEPKRYQTTNDVLNFKGIVTHINYRVDGKWDIGPAFNWKKVIDGVQVPEYTLKADRSANVKERDSTVDEAVINSETELEQYLPAAKDPSLQDQPYEELVRTADEENDKSVKKPKPKLYALLVGIDDYEAGLVLTGGVIFPALTGCVNDANKMKTYLQRDLLFDPEIKLLTNKKATKAEIVRAFKEHLGQAKAGDVVLFYYSGHGTQEKADTTVWTSDTDGKLECIACYYDKNSKDDFLLADKELRYMLHQISAKKPHVVTIFDCCHSADNTRNGMLATTVFPRTVEKRIAFVFGKRDWSKFIFSSNVSREDVIQKGEAAAIPEGLHIQLSACESDESAVEEEGEGVFTKTLLKVLQTTGGDVTYQALRNRIRQYLRNVYEQKPRIYVANGEEALLYSIFLNKPSKKSKIAFGEVTYNEEIGWQLNLGAIHGIGQKTKEILVMDSENIKESYKAKIGVVNTDTTELILPSTLDHQRVYQGYVEGLSSKTLQVNIQNIDGLPEDQQLLMDLLSTATNESIVTEDDEGKAQYVLRCRNGKYYITYPKDPFRPLAAPVNLGDKTGPLSVVQYFKHISQWEFLKNLKNDDTKSKLRSDALKVEIKQVDNNGRDAPLELSDGEANFRFALEDGQWKTNMRVRLTNTTDTNLYCCALYLSSSFGSFSGFLNPPVYLLEGGNSVDLKIKDNSSISVKVGDVSKFYNWKEQVEYLKFIVSTDEFDAQALSLEELPKPPTPSEKRRGKAKGLDTGQESPADIWGWTTKLITLRFQNPEADSIRDSDLKIMLNDPEIADFALGLYFDASVGEDLQPIYQLKPGIQLITEDEQFHQKGIIRDKVLDLANLWARSRRNNQYKEVIKRFPQRLRIVSEGDSWFQHPLVLDVIDHLSRVYAIYCVAAAGDTLRNYLSREKENGEYFLDAIDEQKPSFFLISGGGNDILGSQFRSYLKDNPDNSKPEGEEPARFLKDSIFAELNSLMDIYRSLFGNLQTHHRLLHVIVHGYDYPVKLNEANKGWLGRYMIEKGISRPGDRRAIIHLIMDTFNDLLKSSAAGFDNVSYIDVRNVVRFDSTNGIDQWYDEIHPNNDGFQQVAMKFMQKIDEVLNKVSVIILREGDEGPGGASTAQVEESKGTSEREERYEGRAPGGEGSQEQRYRAEGSTRIDKENN